MHIAWQLPEAYPTALELERRCRAEGVGVYSTEAANAVVTAGAKARCARTLLLGFTALDEAQITEGARRIAVALESG